jgi:hypothetical protein
MSETIGDLDAQEKALLKQLKSVRKKKQYKRSEETKPICYYIKNGLIVLLIFGYIFAMYGPYHFM